jgi:cytochrome c
LQRFRSTVLDPDQCQGAPLVAELHELKENDMKHHLIAAIGFLLQLNSIALAEGDATKGATIFKKCVACHDATNAKNKTGPHLLGIVGRNIASVPDYKFSAAMLEYAKLNETWDEEKLDTYFSDPRKTVPGTKMAFGPLRNAEDRAHLIAYLKTLVSP